MNFQDLVLNSQLKTKSIAQRKDDVRKFTWNHMKENGELCRKSWESEPGVLRPGVKWEGDDYGEPWRKIPFFKGWEKAATDTIKLREFKKSKVIKVNPSMSMMKLRQHTLDHEDKTLIVPLPNIDTEECFRMLRGSDAYSNNDKAFTKRGAQFLGQPLSALDWPPDLTPIDLVVVGAFAVNPSNGVRLGKGKGLAEIEWAILCEMGIVDPLKTKVLTMVHESQIYDDDVLPADMNDETDLPVDIVVTPYRYIRVRPRPRKPRVGIVWEKLPPGYLDKIPTLRKMKELRDGAAEGE